MNRSMLKALVGATGLVVATAAPSRATAQTGYAWANEPTAAEYEPNRLYSFNAGGGRVLISRLGTGSYNVQFEGLGGKGVGGGDVHVTSYGPGSSACKVVVWSYPAPNFQARVDCFGSDGAPTDAMFTILAGWPTGSGGSTVVPAPGAGRHFPPIPPLQRPGDDGKADAGTAASVAALSAQINALYGIVETLRARINELSK